MTKEIALRWLHKAESSLEDARILFDARVRSDTGRSIEGACNRAAASVSQMMRALLTKYDQDYKTYDEQPMSDIKVLFAKAYIKTKICDLNTYHGINKADYFIRESEQGLDRIFTLRDAEEMISFAEQLHSFTSERLAPESAYAPK